MKITGFSTRLDNFPKQMYYLSDERDYSSRKLVNITKAFVYFPDHIAPQLWIEGVSEDNTFIVGDDGRHFRQLMNQEQAYPPIICDGCNVRAPFEHRCHRVAISIQGERTDKICGCPDCK